jgi:hypothetical protein
VLEVHWPDVALYVHVVNGFDEFALIVGRAGVIGTFAVKVPEVCEMNKSDEFH